jgi:hypothetical protein
MSIVSNRVTFRGAVQRLVFVFGLMTAMLGCGHSSSPSDGTSKTASPRDQGAQTLVPAPPATQASVELVMDDSLQSAVASSVALGFFWEPPPALFRMGDDVEGYVRTARKSPIDLAFDVVFRSGGLEWHAGQFACYQGGDGGANFQANLGGISPRAVDIVLRPSAQVAEKFRMKKILGKEVVFHEVRLPPADPYNIDIR